MKNSILALILMTLLLFTFSTQVSADNCPNLLNYQGRATDGSNNPVSDGSHNFVFKIFDRPSAGSLLWQEPAVGTLPITTASGLFSTVLGFSVPFSATLFNDNDSTFLEVTIDGQAISPRARLTSVAYSRRVFSVEGAAGGTVTGDLGVTGSIDSPGPGSKISYLYADQTAFPSALSYHGAIAHSHLDGKLFFAHAGAWVPLANEDHAHFSLDASDGFPVNQVFVNSAGLVGIANTSPAHPLHVGTGPTNGNGAHCTVGGVWTNGSDRNTKENFQPVDPKEMLEKISALEITEWNYKNENKTEKHIGPMAQDFYALFGVGSDDKTISTIDPSGVALVAIQELYRKSQELDRKTDEIEALKAEVAKVQKMLALLSANK